MSLRVACKNKWRHIEALGRNAEFLATYADALEAYHAGDTDIRFPAGTYTLFEQGYVFREAG